MRLAGKLIATAVILILLALTILLALLHTRYATAMITYGINVFSPTPFSAKHIGYSINDPWRLTLQQPQITGPSSRPLTAEQVEIWLTPAKLFYPGWHFDTILVDGLSVTPDLPLPTIPALSASRLALTNFNLQTPDLRLRNSQLQLDNWHSQPQGWGQFSGDFQLSAEEFRWQQLTLSNLLLDGDHYERHWKLYGFSFDWQHASLNGQAEYLTPLQETATLRLHQLTISGLQLQEPFGLNVLKPHFSQLTSLAPNIDIRRLDVLSSSIEHPDFTLNDASLSLQNWHWPTSYWQQQDAFLSLSADSLRWHGTVMETPLIELGFSPQQITIAGASAKLLEGYIRADGAFTPDMLALNQLTINGIKWFLADNWPAQLQDASKYFDDISLTALDISHAQITAPHPDMPFQLSGLNASGQDLILKRHGRSGLWQGELTASAGLASVNSITMDEPLLAMRSQSGLWQLSQLLIPFRHGLLEAEGQVALNRDGLPWQLNLAADSIPASVLPKWLQLPLPVSGAMDIELAAQGLGQHATGLAYSLSGELKGEFRRLQLERHSTAQLWQQWSRENISAWPGGQPGHGSPLTASPLHVRADRGRLTIRPLSVSGPDFSATLQGLWDLASPAAQSVELKATQGCRQLSRLWAQGQIQLSLSSCDGSSI